MHGYFFLVNKIGVHAYSLLWGVLLVASVKHDYNVLCFEDRKVCCGDHHFKQDVLLSCSQHRHYQTGSSNHEWARIRASTEQNGVQNGEGGKDGLARVFLARLLKEHQVCVLVNCSSEDKQGFRCSNIRMQCLSKLARPFR